jgi:hypothetical protein
MTTVSIVGIRGAGKTTSLGLLNQGLNAYALHDKNFQFGPDLKSMGYLNDIVLELRAGEWPAATTEGTQQEVSFKLRFKKPIGWREVDIGSYDISGEDIERTLEAMTKARSMQEIIASMRDRKALAAILNSDVFIFVVDSMVCDPTHSAESERKKADHDLHLAYLCRALQTYKEKGRGKIKALGIIFAKYDQMESFLPLGKVDYYSSESKDLFIASEKEAGKDVKAFEDVVKTYLANTYASLVFSLKNVSTQNMKYFRSGITMKTDEATGKQGISLPLEFTAGEYIRIAKWLSDM